MFNLNEDNRIVMAQHPTDMRMGVNGMCGQVRKVGLDPTNGDNTFGIYLCLASHPLVSVFLPSAEKNRHL